uniref:FBA_2 domain-containing protein n=1 Tax=Caenorhabditis tropicalis TaxID=1561998 RepID=A0A1I7U3T1_9PELO
MAHPPDQPVTFEYQAQRVREWLASIARPNGIHFLDIESDTMLVFMKTLDRKTRSNLEKTCKSLLSTSRREKPRLNQLFLCFTTTWNHDKYVEITASFSSDFIFRAVFINKEETPAWITGEWCIDKKKNMTSGYFQPEKLRLSATFVERTSRYIEYWLRNFQVDTLKIKVENLIPGKENEIQQMNYLGPIPPLRLKKCIIHGANNIRFIKNWMDSIIPDIIDPIDPYRKTIDVEFHDVGKLNQIFHHTFMTTGKVNLIFHRVNTLFTRRTLHFLNSPKVDIVARQVPSEAVNIFLKRWSRGEMTEDFQYMIIKETTQWKSQAIQIRDALCGLRYQPVDLKTDVPLRILKHRKEKDSEKCQIFQIMGPRHGFCVHSGNEFIFEVPETDDLPNIIVDPPMIQNTIEYERHKNRIYMELFRKRLIRLFN